MTHRRIAFPLHPLLAVALALAPAVTGRADEPDDLASLLRRQTQELMDAVAPGEIDVWQRYLLDDVVYLDEDGVVHDKASLLRELKPLPPGLVGRIEVDRFALTRHGEIAVVAAEIQEYLDYHSQPLRTRFRFLDTWLRTPDGWRLAARHIAAVLKDPPAIVLSREELCAYAGTYRLTPEIVTTVRCDANALVAERTGRPPETLLAERATSSSSPAGRAAGASFFATTARSPRSPTAVKAKTSAGRGCRRRRHRQKTEVRCERPG